MDICNKGQHQRARQVLIKDTPQPISISKSETGLGAQSMPYSFVPTLCLAHCTTMQTGHQITLHPFYTLYLSSISRDVVIPVPVQPLHFFLLFLFSRHDHQHRSGNASCPRSSLTCERNSVTIVMLERRGPIEGGEDEEVA